MHAFIYVYDHKEKWYTSMYKYIFIYDVRTVCTNILIGHMAKDPCSFSY